MDAIPLFDLTQQYPLLAPALLDRIQQVLASGQYVNGPFVSQFESEFAQFLGGSHQVIGCNSGTDALYLSLRALGVGSGDEVITSAFSFFASAEVISLTGARPVFVDIDPASFNLDPSLLIDRITPRTKAIIPVHLFGQAADMTRVMEIAKQHSLLVVEDCAQAVGSCWAGQQVGTIGELGAFSFYPTKNLAAIGDGGAVITQDPQLADRIRILKNHGQPRLYEHDRVGINSRLDALQAAILSVKLPYLREWNQRRRSLAEYYHQLLGGIPDLILPSEIPGGCSVWNQYTVKVVGDGSRRDQVQKYLKEMGISARIYYPIPLHLQPVYHKLGYQSGDFPASEQCAAQVLSLPLFPELTGAQQERVASGVRKAMLSTVMVGSS